MHHVQKVSENLRPEKVRDGTKRRA